MRVSGGREDVIRGLMDQAQKDQVPSWLDKWHSVQPLAERPPLCNSL